MIIARFTVLDENKNPYSVNTVDFTSLRQIGIEVDEAALTVSFGDQMSEYTVPFEPNTILQLFKDGKLIATVDNVFDAEKAVSQTVFNIPEEQPKQTQ